MADRTQIPSSSSSSSSSGSGLSSSTKDDLRDQAVNYGHTMSEGDTGFGTQPEDETTVETRQPIVLYIPPRYMLLPAAGAVTGLSIGLIRGARAASWQFLAENAHRAPTTVQGWYFYKKTKNYKMMWGGLKEGGRDAIKIGVVGLAWATLEDGIERVADGRVEEVKEVGAGLGTAAMFSAVCECQLLFY